MDFMQADGETLRISEENPPTNIFYGVSQGGIFGSSYTQWMKTSKLIDRSVIVAAGAPFSFLMSRSTTFPDYQRLLLLNIHTNRQLRLFISLMQIFYDGTEIGSVLNFEKETRQVNFKTLLQNGLGDSTVTTLGAEFMARAYEASVVPNNPREVFGVPEADNMDSVQ